MRVKRVLISAAVLMFAMPVFAAFAVTFSEQGFLMRDGRPCLILGLYELPEDDAVLKSVADAGFNLIRSKADKETLDRIQRYGLHAWIPLSGELAVEEGDSAGETKLAATINGLKDHPALLAWEAPDESLWNEWYSGQLWVMGEQVSQLRGLIKQKDPAQVPEFHATLEKAIELGRRALWKESEAVFAKLWQNLGATNPHPELNMTIRMKSAQEMGHKLTRGWQFVSKIDDQHVFWQNHAPRNAVVELRQYNQAVHAAGCDIYPVPFNHGVGHSDLTDINLTSVRRLHRADAAGRTRKGLLDGPAGIRLARSQRTGRAKGRKWAPTAIQRNAVYGL